MKTYHTLVKAARHAVEALQKELSQLEYKKEKLEEGKQGLLDQLKAESTAAGEAFLIARFDLYLKQCRNQIAKFDAAIAHVDREIDVMVEQMREAFQELKRFEIIRDQKLSELEEEALLKEIKMLDEIASVQHQRKESGADG